MARSHGSRFGEAGGSGQKSGRAQAAALVLLRVLLGVFMLCKLLSAMASSFG